MALDCIFLTAPNDVDGSRIRKGDSVLLLIGGDPEIGKVVLLVSGELVKYEGVEDDNCVFGVVLKAAFV